MSLRDRIEAQARRVNAERTAQQARRAGYVDGCRWCEASGSETLKPKQLTLVGLALEVNREPDP